MSEILPDPRKRPRQARSVATFEAILEAAARILESLGFAGFNTNAVAELAGVSIGSLYQYFPSKESLIVELIRRERAQLSNHIAEAIKQHQAADLKEKLKLIIQAAVQHQLSRLQLARTLEFASELIGKDVEESELQYELETIISDLFMRSGISQAQTVAQDVIALSKGMINAAGIAGESDLNHLQQRVEKAVFGYLDLD
ncbi:MULTISPECIES: TetR/AcrR family transcriptional regulator [Acinetobacter]|jgi:AcrR family transcriptional regulator|uniref:TetR/AcrR family transcriptional regulator n=1 Tax=Acinetobacter TaxID=469 RepID=UPI00044941A9|nr:MULTISPECIES: TetR/AcrR family transcriptional regulator [Acinetobacter]MDQ9823195.1 TetR/AcrR family transcriptional regulator [Acinetobacter sp. 163]SSR41106.1 TetR family transcriptional regulator [Acinetobacter baumannii]EHU1211743.1 TetR/AcrR family transcriptional regulator [Acinetobacter nosocomialis]EXH09250.1 bacterial regulatory s, tetR family protein [Acinetobacter sp. 1245593]EXR26991.1 bacterial regulatory s, tetR family protein [Acinetobacter sp. 1281984]